MTFGDLASLAVAYSDLKLVTSVTRAINANLPKTGPLGTIPAATRSLDPRPRLRSTPERQYAARQVLAGHQSVRPGDCCGRYVDHYEPTCPNPPVIVQPVIVEAAHRSASPFLPPWAKMPPVPPVRVVKVVHQRVDLLGRGGLLDVFV